MLVGLLLVSGWVDFAGLISVCACCLIMCWYLLVIVRFGLRFFVVLLVCGWLVFGFVV